MIKIDKRLTAELAALALFIALVAYLVWSFDLIELFSDRQRMLAFIRENRAHAVAIFIGMQVAQVIAAPLPGEVTGFAGGVLFGPVWGILYSTIGLTIGSWLAFMLARIIGRPLVSVVARPETIRRYDYVMKHKGLFLAFLLFLIPGFPKDILSYLLGLGHMGQRAFLLVSTAGRLLGTTLLTIGGTLYRDERYGAFFTVLAVSIAAILPVMIYRERLEGWFRSMRFAERMKARAERRSERRRVRKKG